MKSIEVTPVKGLYAKKMGEDWLMYSSNGDNRVLLSQAPETLNEYMERFGIPHSQSEDVFLTDEPKDGFWFVLKYEQCFVIDEVSWQSRALYMLTDSPPKRK